MNFQKPPDPPDRGRSENNCTYESSIMDSEDIGIIIRKIPSNNSITSDKDSNIRAQNQFPATSANPIVPPVFNFSASNMLNTAENKSNNNSNTSLLKPQYKFDISDVGPFVVILESNENNLGSLHPMSIGKLIMQEHKELDNFIHSINTAGRNRVKIIFKSAFHANRMLDSTILKQKNIKAYIPQYLLRRFGVIRHVDISLTEADIKQMISPIGGESFTVLEIQRLKRKITIEGKDPEYKPTSSVKIIFKGQRLPSCISLCKVVCQVEPFVHKVVQCFNCLRYGHVSAQCKSKTPRCCKCGEDHKAADCKTINPPCCLFCKGNHTALDRNVCKEYKKQKAIKLTMATDNLSYRDANSKVNNSYATTVAQVRCTPEDFPSLHETRKRKKFAPAVNMQYVAENVHKDFSGNGVCLKTNINTLDSNTYKILIEELVKVVIEMSQKEIVNAPDCESAIKNIVEHLLKSNVNKHSTMEF